MVVDQHAMDRTGQVNDPQRLQALRASGLLDAETVAALDRVTAMVRRLLGVPVALVSLVEEDRQVFAGACGLSDALAETRQTPLSHSYCRYVVNSDAPFIITDARTDARLAGHPAVAEYEAIAYAGFPLRNPDGQVLGALCVVDTQVRHWTPEELAILADMAACAESEIALRLAHRQQLLNAAKLQAIIDSAHDAFIALTSDGLVTGWNTMAETLFGYSAAETYGQPLTQLIIPQRFRAAHAAGLARVRDTGTFLLAGQRLQLHAIDRAGREFPIEMTLQMVTADDQQPVFHAFLHDVTDRHRAEALRQARQAVAEAIAEARYATDAGVGAVSAITQAMGWTCGEYWQVDDDRQTITRESSWTTPGRDLSGFTNGTPVTFRHGEGLAGAVWEQGGPVG